MRRQPMVRWRWLVAPYATVSAAVLLAIAVSGRYTLELDRANTVLVAGAALVILLWVGRKAASRVARRLRSLVRLCGSSSI